MSPLVPPSDLPAYPSEDAVLSGVTAEMLKLLFPAAVEEITRKAAEQRKAARPLRSRHRERRRRRSRARQGSRRVGDRPRRRRWHGHAAEPGPVEASPTATARKARSPGSARRSAGASPMLPNFGSVKAWTMTPAEVVALRARRRRHRRRPAQMRADVAEVRETVDHLTRSSSRSRRSGTMARGPTRRPALERHRRGRTCAKRR